MISWERAVVLICLTLAFTASVSSAELVFPQHPAESSEGSHFSDNSLPQVCVVIRTYWAHAKPSGLRALIHSLQRQSFQRWEAVLLVLDGKPFDDLAHTVQDFEDDRIWTFAEWIGLQFAPHAEEGWAHGYHHQLYNLTDEAIRACPASTQWVVVTNGDNEYASTLFQTLLNTAPDEDLVALDFYSRYQRPTGAPCLRFALQEGYPPCKVNKMQWCHTDLGANILRWPRLVAEDHRFGGMSDKSGGLTAEHFDGLMMMNLMSSGWKARHVEGRCLFEHSPSPQRCARQGGAWDESQISPESPIGGECISQGQADALLASFSDHVEELNITLSTDGAINAFDKGLPGNQTTIRCLRRADAEAQQAGYMRFFGPYCTAEVDMEEFEAHLLAQNMDEVNDQRAAWAEQSLSSGAGSRGRARPSRPKEPPKPPPKGVKIDPSLRRRLPFRI
ncbi:hypothetical protein WJX73_008320 [Symbiochloris irregularis]|uniref:Uncharacterized protein n=1 Tax=Symbiochloris irregularis TaxID=706552 RepID=A0AAW1PUZ2_9CHLO